MLEPYSLYIHKYKFIFLYHPTTYRPYIWLGYQKWGRDAPWFRKYRNSAMFPRAKSKIQNGTTYTYYQLVEAQPRKRDVWLEEFQAGEWKEILRPGSPIQPP
mgnify:CR=1 FL=1